MKRALLLLSLSLLLGFAGCASTSKQAWVEDVVEARTERMLWEVLRLSLDRAGFAVGVVLKPEARAIESGWKVDTSPFKGRGWRKRAHVKYAPVEGAPRQWKVEVRVEMETNESFRGIDLRYAKWTKAPDDETSADIIMQFARSLLQTRQFEVNRP